MGRGTPCVQVPDIVDPSALSFPSYLPRIWATPIFMSPPSSEIESAGILAPGSPWSRVASQPVHPLSTPLSTCTSNRSCRGPACNTPCQSPAISCAKHALPNIADNAIVQPTVFIPGTSFISYTSDLAAYTV